MDNTDSMKLVKMINTLNNAGTKPVFSASAIHHLMAFYQEQDLNFDRSTWQDAIDWKAATK